MKASTLIGWYGEDAVEGCIDLNPLQVAEMVEFNRPAGIGGRPKSYRQRALDSVTRNKLPFEQTFNAGPEIARAWVNVVCPYCEGEHPGQMMQPGDSGMSSGAGVSCSTTYACPCGANVVITISGFSAKPGNDK